MADVAQSEKTKVKKGLRIDDNFSFKLARVFPLIYLVALCVFFIAYKVYPGPGFLVLCIFVYAAYKKRAQRFMKDWFPFIASLLAYDAMRGIVDNIAGIVHVTELIDAELRLFGTIPTLLLQQFYRCPVLDWVGAFFYSLHFIVPVVFGFILWNRFPENYQKYSFALLVSSFSALITFLVYPSAPPWFGVGAERILFQMDGVIGVPLYATIYAFFQPNPFAALPSIHAAYPWLIFLYAIKTKRTKALPTLIFPLGVCFSAVYLGEHYIIDLLAGIAYSTAAFFLVEKIATQPFFVSLLRKFSGSQLRNTLAKRTLVLKNFRKPMSSPNDTKHRSPKGKFSASPGTKFFTLVSATQRQDLYRIKILKRISFASSTSNVKFQHSIFLSHHYR